MAETASSPTLWLACPVCKLAKSVGLSAETEDTKCRGCGREAIGKVFPRAFAPAGPPPVPVASPVPGDSVCFYDPEQKATCLCSQCGVLASDAWSASWGSRKVCLRCLEKLRAGGKDKDFESGRVMWDNICLLLALAPLSPMSYFLVVVTAPAALVLGLRSWNKPRSLAPRSRLRLILALILAGIEVLLMIIGGYMLFETFSGLSEL